jgi:putative ABC transport system permease protein
VIRLGLASLRSRSSSFAAYFVSVLCGTTIIGAFATLLADSTGQMPSDDRETLFLIGAVVGSWGLVIVLFSVVSTLTLTIRQRAGETGLLRTIGATGAQTRRMLLLESTVVTVVAAALATVPARLIGGGLLAALKQADLVSERVRGDGGWPAVAAGSAAIVLVSLLAGVLATRRAGRISARAALLEGGAGSGRISRWRVGAGILLVLAAVNYSILTVTVTADPEDPLATMSTAGPACVFASLGLATLAPVLLRSAAGLGAGLLEWFGAAGHLAAHDLRARSQLLAGVLAPVIIFVGIGTGTFYLVAIGNRAAVATTSPARTLELLNYVVVGMITTFAGIMVVNTLTTVISARLREFGQQRLAGATPGQLRSMMRLEAGFLVVTGTVLGAIGSLTTVLPYSWVRLGRVVPDLGPGYFLAVAVTVTVVTLGATAVATGRALRPDAVRAVTAVTG